MGVRAAMLLGFALLAGCGGSGPRDGYYLTIEEAERVYGTYWLSNGDILRVSRAQRRYWAEMQRTGRIEIVPVDSIVFKDRRGRFRFTFDTSGWETEVRIEGLYPPGTHAPVHGFRSGIEGKFGE